MGFFRRGQVDAATAGTDRATELLVRAGRGDEAAFAEFYDETARLVFGVVLRVVRDRAMAEEITQEVYVELWRLATRFDNERGSAKTWATTLAHRRAVDRVRSEQSRRDREQREFTTSTRTEGQVDDVFADVEARQTETLQAERVERALGQLTDKQREAIELAYYGGRTYREVAALLDTPEGTIKTRIRDGMIRLRDDLGVSA